MSVSYVSAKLRQELLLRALGVCEYCLIHEDDTYWGCQVDHVISEKHGGETALHNLALACTTCNRNKGSDVGSVTSADEFARFFNPRTDSWLDHFEIVNCVIVAKTSIGDVTEKILRFNISQRLEERTILSQVSRYLTIDAQKFIEQQS